MDLDLRQRISDALLKASFSDWDVGEGTVIELPLAVAESALRADEFLIWQISAG